MYGSSLIIDRHVEIISTSTTLTESPFDSSLKTKLLNFNSGKGKKFNFKSSPRSIFKFNQGFDKYVLKPVNTEYEKLPDNVKRGVSNHVTWASTPVTIVNSTNCKYDPDDEV